jgi:hypothetical protein
VLELAAEGDASVLDAIATGATSDQARVLLQEQGVALVCADSAARHPATAWPGVVRRLAAVSRSGGPPLGWTTPAPRTVCPSDRLPFDPEFGQPHSLPDVHRRNRLQPPGVHLAGQVVTEITRSG